MSVLIVVNEPRDWPLEGLDAEVVSAREYLTDPRYTQLQGAKVFNLCRSHRYQATGYYVSLLATARGHKPVPDVTAIQDLKNQALVRIAAGELDDLVQNDLRRILSSRFVLSIYFGQNLAARHARLARALFQLFPMPFMRATFARGEKDSHWRLESLTPMAASDIPEEHRSFVVEVTQEFFRARHRHPRRKRAPRYDLAILVDPQEAEPPSDSRALQRFVRTAEKLGCYVECIGKKDQGRLAEFDALLLRETTQVHHHTYRMARRAAAEGLVVIDDPESILRCTNKVFLAEILERNRISTPRTMVVHRDNQDHIEPELGLPVILKQPDSSFSQGVLKVDMAADLRRAVGKLLERSDLIIAQEYLPTEFDWRVGIFDRKPLYVCRYYMARGQWQIVKRDAGGTVSDGGSADTLAVADAPARVVRTALRAANLIGDGLYGVDLKQVGRSVRVIEINDNPSIDSGVEDAVLGEELYRTIVAGMLARVDARRGGRAHR